MSSPNLALQYSKILPYVLFHMVHFFKDISRLILFRQQISSDYNDTYLRYALLPKCKYMPIQRPRFNSKSLYICIYNEHSSSSSSSESHSEQHNRLVNLLMLKKYKAKLIVAAFAHQVNDRICKEASSPDHYLLSPPSPPPTHFIPLHPPPYFSETIRLNSLTLSAVVHLLLLFPPLATRGLDAT